MNISFLGNRLQDLGGFQKNPLQDAIITKIKAILLKESTNKPTILTSLTPGIEFWAGDFAQKMGLPIQVYIPCNNWASKWPKGVQSQYEYLLKKAKKVIKLSESEWNIKIVQQKDARIYADSDKIYTFYNPLPPLITKGMKDDKVIIDALPDDEEFFIKI